MKLSLKWIRDFVDLPADLDLTRLSYDLTMSTVEVEGAENLADRFKNILVGVLTAVEAHPNADSLRVCSVDLGEGEPKDIVCGGSNLAVGMRVAVAVPGAFVRWHGEGEPVEIKETKLRGVESCGMICAASEIGLAELFPAADEREIVDLSAFDAPAGTPIAEALGFDDVILEIDNKSMTNRPDLWGRYGIARELAALYDLPLKPIEPFKTDVTVPVDVRIEDPDRSPRFIGVRLEGLGVKPSPFEMQSRLWRVGLRPINALVDVTNYVMLATGQPTHVYDATHIVDHFEVRTAKAGETLRLLNDKEIALTEDDLVIADAEGPVGVAGVMGGAKDSVLHGTESVLLEVANFDARSVRRTALRYDNRTDASSRYEKGVDPQRCDQGLAMCMALFAELYPEMRVTAFTDCFPKPLAGNEIDVSFDWLDRRLGKRVGQEEISKKLGALGFTVDFSETGMHITVPTWRSTGDVSIKADIMEEVARMVGYENFEPTSITATFDGAINQLDFDLVRRVKEYLAFRCGMQEIFTYPWMSEEFVRAILPENAPLLALATPPSPEEKYIRCSLLPNICKAIVKNERNFDAFDIFEEAMVFTDSDYTETYRGESLPGQKKHLGLAFCGAPQAAALLFRRAKGVLEQMSSYTHMEGFTFEKLEKPCWADDTAWLNILLNGERIGAFGLLSKKAALACGVKVCSAVLAELDMSRFVPFKSRTNRFARVSEFPKNDYDLSLLVDSMVRWEDILAALREKRHELLRAVRFIDEYKGKQIPEGKKSVTIRLEIASDEKTLTGAEIEAVANAVVKRLSKVLGADIRNG